VPGVPASLRRWIASAGLMSTYPVMHREVVLGGFSPTALMKAYDITPLRAAGFDGSGQTVIFPEIDGVDTTALARFDSLYGLPRPRLTIHGSQLSAGDEATMDVEVVHAIAPRARLVVFNFNTHVTNAGWTQETLHMIRSGGGHIISSSVGGCDGSFNGTDATAYASVFQQADLMGISTFASSGDNGAYDCLPHGQAPSNGALGVDMPAALPGVTGVGGTTLEVDGSGNWAREAAWEGPIETSGGGGGVSRFFSRPGWQSAPGVRANLAMNQYGRRMVPDVSADADPLSGAALIFPSGAGQGGGTSQAAPIWAGVTALIDQYLTRNNHHIVGFMNPALYDLARTTPAYPAFHDVTMGTNLHYPATPGYDMATGLGTPDAWNLARDLLDYQKARGQ
ncbi:MAG: S8 family serine peptidase, partial [Opitutales bacterium]